jgi:hypothetical protein
MKYDYSSIDTGKLKENLINILTFFLGIYCQKMLLVLIWVVVLVDEHNSSLQKLKL